MTSNGVLMSPTTEAQRKDIDFNELRLPAKFIANGFKKKLLKEAEALVYFKLVGSRVNVKTFARLYGITVKTAKRLITRLEKLQWVGFDKKFVFPRSWSRLGYKKSRGYYLCTAPDSLKHYLFVWALKFTQRLWVRARKKLRSATPKDLPVRYYTKSLNLSERTYFRLLAGAVQSGLIRSDQQYKIEGNASEFHQLRAHLHETQLFVNLYVRKIKGQFFTVTPQPSELTFLI